MGVAPINSQPKQFISYCAFYDHFERNRSCVHIRKIAVVPQAYAIMRPYLSAIKNCFCRIPFTLCKVGEPSRFSPDSGLNIPVPVSPCGFPLLDFRPQSELLALNLNYCSPICRFIITIIKTTCVKLHVIQLVVET